MTVTRRTYTDATIVYGGVWTTAADANCNSGGYTYATAAGATMTVTLPANHGFSTLFLQGLRFALGGTASVTVDGVAQAVWNQTSFTSDTTTIEYRCCTPPITLNPAKGTTQVIVVTVLTGTIYADGYEVYVPEAIVAGRLLVCGHSIPAGVGVTTATAYGGLLAAWLGMTQVNNALQGEVLAQGSVLANNGTGNGGSTGTLAPGWYRVVDQQTLWAAQTPEIATLHYGINDVRQRGNNDPAGATGRGYGIEQFAQRLREAIWRMNARCPATLIVVLGIGYVTHSATTGGYTESAQTADWQHGTEALGFTWSNALAAVCQESTMKNVLYVDTYRVGQAVGDWALQTPATDGVHPTTDGHLLIAQEVYRRLQAARLPTVGRRGGVV